MFNSGFGSFTLTLYNLNYGIPELNGTQEERQDAVQVTVQVGTQGGTQRRQDTVQVAVQDTVQVGTQDGTQNVHQDVHQGVHQGRQDGRQDRRQDRRQEEEPQKIVNVSLSEILEYCKTPRSIKEILEFCGAKSRTTFIKNHLATLISEGKLRMTIPDKPNSKNQKYTSRDFS